MKKRILLGRPEGENESLAAMLTPEYEILVRPLIKLSEKSLNSSLKKTAMDLDHYDRVIFVSKSSVRFAMPLLDSYWPQWPVAVKWYAVGPGTADALAAFDVKAAFPAVPGSEGLLAMMVGVDGEKILIARGEGGRELLGDELRRRGATVEYWEVYRREPQVYEDWQFLESGTPVVLTSVEMLTNLAAQIGDKKIHECDAVVASKRIADAANTAGFRRVEIAAGASDEALYDAIHRLCRHDH
jgi:uroporphyrinogen-III synthase